MLISFMVQGAYIPYGIFFNSILDPWVYFVDLYSIGWIFPTSSTTAVAQRIQVIIVKDVVGASTLHQCFLNYIYILIT